MRWRAGITFIITETVKNAIQMYHVLWFNAALTQTKCQNSHVVIHLPTDLLGTV